jgi:hypothetical protein
MMWCLYTGCDPGRLHITEVLETVPRYLDNRRQSVDSENPNDSAEKWAQAARGFLACPGQLSTLHSRNISAAQCTEKSRTRPRKTTIGLGQRRETPRSEFGIYPFPETKLRTQNRRFTDN